tara:strand:+ start:1087 stop:1896 length:810 start_codon:yes stop_codon:yes gene_type:complete
MSIHRIILNNSQNCPYCYEDDCQITKQNSEKSIKGFVEEYKSEDRRTLDVNKILYQHIDDPEISFRFPEKCLAFQINEKKDVNFRNFLADFHPSFHCLRIEINREKTYAKLYKYNKHPWGCNWESLEFNRAKRKMLADRKKINNIFCMNENDNDYEKSDFFLSYEPKYFLEMVGPNEGNIIYRFRPVLFYERYKNYYADVNKHIYEIFDKCRGRYSRYYTKFKKLGGPYTVADSIFFPRGGDGYDGGCENSGKNISSDWNDRDWWIMNG